jgi:hypothetical protein
MNIQIKFNNGVGLFVPFNSLLDNNDVIHPDCYTLSEDGDIYFFSTDTYIFENNTFRELTREEMFKLNLANHAECISVSCSKHV